MSRTVYAHVIVTVILISKVCKVLILLYKVLDWPYSAVGSSSAFCALKTIQK